MKYNELTVAKQKHSKRVGRGISGGQGKTAGRGTKGQGSRKSGGVRPGFEGGQMPLYMRLPHLQGFKSRAPKVEVVYTGQLEIIKAASIDNQVLYDAGIVSSPHTIVKLLVKGDLNSKKDARLQAASKSAQDMLTKAGGSFTKIAQQGRPAKKKSSEAA